VKGGTQDIVTEQVRPDVDLSKKARDPAPENSEHCAERPLKRFSVEGRGAGLSALSQFLHLW